MPEPSTAHGTPVQPYAAVSDIQRCSFDDGDGLRTTVFLKSCPLHCPWCHNPETISAKPVLLYNASRCIGCKTCAADCPDGLLLPIAGEISCAALSGCRGCTCPQDALRVSGRYMPLDKIMAVIREDAPFYAASGGGVTLSGGEPLMQPELCLALAESCRNEGIPVLLDTSGCVDCAPFDSVLAAVDEIYLDLKLPPARYPGVCGALRDFEQNLHTVVRSGKPYALRVPLIPGFSAERDTAREMAQYAADHGVDRVHLLPYNPLAASKYAQLCRPWSFPKTWLSHDRLTELLNVWQAVIPHTVLK